ncbi:protein slowmo [Tanacetum coccineum]
MVRAYSQEHVYKHPWERVTSASWRKFADPENKHTLSHILEVDTLNHKLDPEEGKLYTTRAITIHAPVAWFLRKIVGQDICHCVESTIVDAKTRSMQLATRNITLQKYVEDQEKIRLLYLVMHFIGWLSSFIVLRNKKSDEKSRYGYAGLWHLYALLALNSWLWSAVFTVGES